jgi:hypothetical protein
MTLLFLPDVGVNNLALFGFGANTYPIQWIYWGLYISNYTPIASDTLTTYTAIECALSGYAEQRYAPTVYVGGVVTHQAQYAAPAFVFSFSAYGGGTTIYGVFAYFEDTQPNSWLIGASLLGTPYPVPAGGGSYAITPTWLEYSA